MERKKQRLWVDPKFKRILKKEAADKEVSILDLTKSAAEKNELSFFEEAKPRKRRSIFDDLVF